MMKQDFVFSINAEARTGLSYQDFLYFILTRVTSALYFDGKDAKENEEIPVDKIQKIMQYISSNVEIEEKDDKGIVAYIKINSEDF